MDVSYNSEPLRITQVPEPRKARGSNMNIADQAFGIEVIVVGCSHYPPCSLFCRGKQEDAGFSAAAKASTTQFLDYSLPEVKVDFEEGPAGPKP